MNRDQENDVILGLMSENAHDRSDALKLIYKHYFPRVEAFVMKNDGDKSDAKDVFQEGAMILYQNIKHGKFRRQSSLFTYTYSICRNIWYQRLQLPKMKTIEAEESDLRFYDLKEGEVNVQALRKVMGELKEDCQKILVGFYYELKSMEELSSIFKLGSAQAAKNKKRRCLNYLSKLISNKGLTYENFRQ